MCGFHRVVGVYCDSHTRLNTNGRAITVSVLSRPRVKGAWRKVVSRQFYCFFDILRHIEAALIAIDARVASSVALVCCKIVCQNGDPHGNGWLLNPEKTKNTRMRACHLQNTIHSREIRRVFAQLGSARDIHSI